MAEDRMLSDEILLGLIKANSGGGGGGTPNYNDLSNKPQIGGVTLSGNKSASDLGLVAAEAGKGLSTNDYTDADKAIVGGVTAALAGKQGELTAGKYIDIDANNEISVEREIPDEAFIYTIQQIGDGIVTITKTVNGAVVFEETYNGDVNVTLDALQYVYNSGVQSYTLLIASDTHEAGFKQVMSWWQRETYTENFSTVDHSGEKLIIKSEMDTALAGKQGVTDNTLQTTDKTVPGAINELKSGLTNYEATTNSALELPENTGKNLIPLSVATLKSINTSGTWNGNAYTFNGVTFTVQTDANDNITGIKATGTATGGAAYMLLVSANNTNPFTIKMLGKTVILNGCPAGGGENTYKINIYYEGQTNVIDTGSGATKTYPTTGGNNNIALNVSNGYEIATGGIMFYPMLRMADITDATFAPYIPSVDSRIEAVESGLTNVNNKLGGVYFLTASIAVAGSIDINTTALSKFVIMTSNNTTGRGLYICYSDGSNNTNADPVKNASGLTLTAGAGKLNVTNGSTGSEREVRVCILVMIGDLTISGVS